MATAADIRLTAPVLELNASPLASKPFRSRDTALKESAPQPS